MWRNSYGGPSGLAMVVQTSLAALSTAVRAPSPVWSSDGSRTCGVTRRLGARVGPRPSRGPEHEGQVGPRRALGSLGLGDRRALSMPGLSATVAEEIEALRRVAGQKAVDLITLAPDETIARIVATWPCDFDTARAHALGFVAETSFDEIVAAHLKDI